MGILHLMAVTPYVRGDDTVTVPVKIFAPVQAECRPREEKRMNAKGIAKRMGLAVLAAGALTASTTAVASAQEASQAPSSFVPATLPAPAAANSVYGPVTDPADGQYYGQLPQHSQARPGTVVYVPAAVAPLVSQGVPGVSAESAPAGWSANQNVPSHRVPSSQYVPSAPAAAAAPAVPSAPAPSGVSNPGWQLYSQLFGSTPAENNDE
jgi:hypothetical protein